MERRENVEREREREREEERERKRGRGVGDSMKDRDSFLGFSRRNGRNRVLGHLTSFSKWNEERT
jgi:hypothetical protein